MPSPSAQAPPPFPLPYLHLQAPTVHGGGPCVRGCVIPRRHHANCGWDPDADPCDCACHQSVDLSFTVPCDRWDTDAGCGPHTTDPYCPGCHPRPRIPYALVCLPDFEAATEALIELPELYRDLTSPTRAGAGGRVSGTAEKRLVLADEPRWMRDWIVGVLGEWCRLLSRPREANDVEAWVTYPELGPLPQWPYGLGLPPLYAPADVPEDDRVVARASARLMRHIPWLLAQPDHADQLVHDLIAVHREARRAAYPAGRAGVLLGPCPRLIDAVPDVPDVGGPDPGVDPGTPFRRPCAAPVRAYITPEADRLIVTCPGCGTSASVWQWRTWMADDPYAVGDLDATADAYALSAWLSGLYAPRYVTPELIRQWAAEGTRHGRLDRVGKRGNRTLFLVRQAEAIARALYGDPATRDT